VVFTDHSAHFRELACQAAWLARRFHAEIILLHVVTPFSYPYGLLEGGHEITARDLHGKVVQYAQKDLDEMLLPQLEGIAVTRVLLRGDPAREIVEAARSHNAGLIVLSTRGEGVLYRLLLGSVTAKVLHDSHVPVWTAAHTSEAADRDHIAMRRILCAVDASPATIELMRWAAILCKDLGAALRLVHAVPSIEAWPERQMDQEFEESLRENARGTIQNLEKAAGIDVPVCVGAGTVPDVVRQEALQHGSDLVIIGRGALQETLGRLRTHAYGIIRNAPCPVLSF